MKLWNNTGAVNTAMLLGTVVFILIAAVVYDREANPLDRQIRSLAVGSTLSRARPATIMSEQTVQTWSP
jgi:hypothetical protein